MTTIEQQVLAALARNTAMLQRRAWRAANKAREAMEEYQRQARLVGGGGR